MGLKQALGIGHKRKPLKTEPTANHATAMSSSAPCARQGETETEGVLTANHMEWLGEGGAAPEAPASGMKADVKIIDYSEPSREKLRDSIAKAIRDDGFFVLINHPVPLEKVTSMLSTAKLFFNEVAYTETDKLETVKRKIGMNTMLRPMTKAARGFSSFEEETLNKFMGPDQKFTFDYALQNDAAFIGRREAFRKEEAALYDGNQKGADVDALKARYHRLHTCEEHLGKNLWPEEMTESETAAAKLKPPPVSSKLLPWGLGGVGLRQGNAPLPTEEELSQDLELLAQQQQERNDTKAPHGFRTACEDYLSSLFPLSMDVLTLILEGAAGLSAEDINRDVRPLFDDPLVINRLISYPPQRTRGQLREEVPRDQLYAAVDARVKQAVAQRKKEGKPLADPNQTNYNGLPMEEYDAIQQEEREKLVEKKVSMSCGAHVDYGAITMIAEDRGKALEMQRRHGPKTYEYLPELPPGALIVSTGFMLEKLSNGKIPATRHRVQNIIRPGDEPEGVPAAGDQQQLPPIVRTAMAFFLDPHPEAFIAPLPQCVPKGTAPAYEGCVAGAKGVRFGDPRYLGRIAENLGVMPAATPQAAVS